MCRAIFALTALPFLLAACTRQVAVPPQQIRPGMDIRNAQVRTLDGYVYSFDRLVFGSDSLTGYNTVAQEQARGGEVAYVEVPVATRLPLALVESVEREKREVGQTVLYGAGLLGLGIIMIDLADVDAGSPQPSPPGKPPIDRPED